VYEPGGLGAAAPDSAKPLFFGQKPAAKNEKNIFVFLKRKKGIHCVERD